MRVIAVVNGKGGTGKSTISANVAGLLAAAGHRVLLVGMDPQGDVVRRDLGCDADDGEGLLEAIQHGRPLHPAQARDGLDVVPGGDLLGDVAALAVSRAAKGQHLAGNFVSALRGLDADYDWAFLDCPPGERALVEVALAASDYVLVPVRSDESSLDGLTVVAQRFGAAQQAGNSRLRLLGVVAFGVNPRASRMLRGLRLAVEEVLEGSAPLFATSVRHLESAAVDARRRGLLVHELEIEQGRQAMSRLDRLRRGSGVGEESLFSRDARALAEDMQHLAEEVVAQVLFVEGLGPSPEAQIIDLAPAPLVAAGVGV
jgi:chromosome partitioning protein